MLTYKPFEARKKKKSVDKNRMEKLEKKYTCRACKQPLTWVEDTNIMSCQNPKCKGVKRVRKLDDGTEIVNYYPSYKTLSNYDRKLIEGKKGTK